MGHWVNIYIYDDLLYGCHLQSHLPSHSDFNIRRHIKFEIDSWLMQFTHCLGYILFVIQSPWFRHQLSSNYGTCLFTWRRILQARMHCKWRHPRQPEDTRKRNQHRLFINKSFYETMITPRTRYSLLVEYFNHVHVNLFTIRDHFVSR